MRLSISILAIAALLALGVSPAIGQGQPEGVPHGQGQMHGKAYGRYCKGESKEHVQGVPGTAFSACVKAMAQLAHDENVTPVEACKELSKKHVKGEQGTPFSRCVKGGAQLRHDQQDEEQQS